jgi:SAM-dependent methyltransferase
MTGLSPYFVIGAARSGTTSLARILGGAANGKCAIEPSPNLNRETRAMLEGRLSDPMATLEATVLPRVRAESTHNAIYGEKNVTYGPFISHLHQALRSRFVYVARDGRDVVSSLVNWHDRKFGSVYRECRESGDLSSEAIEAAAALPVHLDTSDYSRPRPPLETPLGREWESLTRAEMCAYYWSTVNEIYVDQLERLPAQVWTRIDYTSPNAEDIARVAGFCGLEGLATAQVETSLKQRINSLEDRGVISGPRYPRWMDWDGGQRRRFERFASVTMERLGYFGSRQTRWRPQGYGRVWSEKKPDPSWYEWMFDGRRQVHEDLLSWITTRDAQGDRIESAMDFGCGLGVGYSSALEGRRYVGVELSAANVAWCAEHRRNARHRYIAGDFIAEDLGERADLVFSSGTIDNAYDADAYLAAMVRHSRKWVHVTCYRGWFPHLEEHRYSFNPEHACFYNDLSLPRMMETLRELGCREITARPVPTGRADIPFETAILARVPELDVH